MKRTVRTTRTWDIEVDAEYGDTYESLCAKVTEDDLDGREPDGENRVVLEEHESQFAKASDRAAVEAEDGEDG